MLNSIISIHRYTHTITYIHTNIDCSHHLRRQQGEGATRSKVASGGIAFHLLADSYPDLLDWVFNVARLKIMEMTTLMAYGKPVPRLAEGATIVYSPSVTY
jgi:hypothetical protein